mmetsp:Transcript_85096/g.134814  ORF Transcript_85096/g.134814 Transcript_85096/m.134814 type:complete len:123 (-) Transcript_85096:126-494(-)
MSTMTQLDEDAHILLHDITSDAESTVLPAIAGWIDRTCSTRLCRLHCHLRRACMENAAAALLLVSRSSNQFLREIQDSGEARLKSYTMLPVIAVAGTLQPRPLHVAHMSFPAACFEGCRNDT